MTQSIETSFLLDPLNKNNAIYRDSLTLRYTAINPKTEFLNKWQSA